jgi:hypothetical protein
LRESRRWCSWLRHYATSRKVAGSIPDGFIGIFNWNNSSGRTMAQGSTLCLTEMSTRNISWGLRRPVRTADLIIFMGRSSWNLDASTSWNPVDLPWPFYRDCFTLLPFTVCEMSQIPYIHFYFEFSISFPIRWSSNPSRFLTQGVQGDLRQGVKVPDRKAADPLSATNAEACEARSQPYRHNKPKVRTAI